MKKMPCIRRYFLSLSLILWSAGAGFGSPDCPDLDITADNRKISIHVNDAPLHCILDQVSRHAGISVNLWQDSHRRITLSLNRVPMDSFFKKLGMGNALVYTRVPETGEYRVVAVDLAAPVLRPDPGTQKPPIESRHPDNDPHQDPHSKPGELLVQFKPAVPEDQIQALHRFMGSSVLKTIPRLNLHQIRFDSRISRDTAIEFYMASGLAASAEAHYLRTPHQIPPSDPKYLEQWGLRAVQAPEAWEISLGKPDLIIAVIDTGVDRIHPDLRRNIWVNAAEAQGLPGEDDDGNGYVDDIHGWDFADNDNDPSDISEHGTHVAGIIGAHTHNGIDIAGVCPDVSIMVLKVAPDDGGDMETIAIVEAIEYAARHGAFILNCSFGGTSFQTVEKMALMNFAASNDGLIICSAGNGAKDIDQSPVFPASYDLPRIISVAASMQDSAGICSLAPFSNFGKTSVDLVAPGDSIVSLLPGKTGILTGTSMATGFVSGAACLLRSHAPQKNAGQIKAILLNHIDPIPLSPGRQLATNGQLNIFKALATQPLPGDMNKNYQIQIPDTVTVLQILSGQTAERISTDIRHWDLTGDNKCGLPESIKVLQKENRFQ